LDRAKLFVRRFFQDGLIFNGHVKPQSETRLMVDGLPFFLKGIFAKQ